MRIAVASGKGGTGKTTVAVGLALSVADHAVQLVDCDVEEPNAHVFLHPTFDRSEKVIKQLPRVDEGLCTQCGQCAERCQFSAIAVLGKKVIVYDQLCHGCGLCAAVCPTDAITEIPHELGSVQHGTASGLTFSQGLLNIGEAMATPVIHHLLDSVDPDVPAILDAPPGTGCPTIAALNGADVAVLVTEPTPFGLHDLQAATGVARALDIPVAVIINRSDVGNEDLEGFCRQEDLPIIMKIPFDRDVAVAYSKGIPLTDAVPEWRKRFSDLYDELRGVTT